MAKSTTGKWVSKVAASGGGKAYKKSRPNNYYGVIALIVVFGLLSVVYSRYEYQNPTTAANGPQPQIGTTWYAALSFQDCGVNLPFISTDPNYKGGFIVEPADVLKISPTSAADAGAHDTLSQFGAEYPGLILSSNELAIPNATGMSNPATTFKNGQTCGSNTKYPGQKGQVEYAYWSSFGQTKPTITTDPTSIKLTKEIRVTLAFDPAGVTPAKPQQATVNAMFEATAAAQTTTTTSAATATTTTVATATTSTTTATATTSTVAPTTTTTAKG